VRSSCPFTLAFLPACPGASSTLKSLRPHLHAMNIYWICVLPFLLWMASLIFAADRINSLKTALLFDLAAIVCFAAGLVLYRYQTFEEKRGFFVVVFAVPLIYLTCFELFRVTYKKLRHEVPCINVRSGRWLGDRPVDGFYTTYPPDKVISWADILFGLSQMMVPLVIVMVLMICSLALDW